MRPPEVQTASYCRPTVVQRPEQHGDPRRDEGGRPVQRATVDSARTHSSEVARRAEQAGNRVPVPATRNLGFGELIRQTAVQGTEHHLMAFAGNLAFRSLLA